MSSMQVTIIGGTGFVGRHLADRLRRTGHRLTLVARLVPPSGGEPDSGVAFVVGDVLEPGSLDPSMQQADVVINLVGAVSQPPVQFGTG